MVVEMTLAPLQFGIPGGMELAVILLIAVLLFGANKIPKLARSTGQAMGEFQRGRTEIEQELQEMADPSAVEDDEEETGPTETTSAETTSTETTSTETSSDDTDETK